MINNSTNFNKTNNHLSPQVMERQKKQPWPLPLFLKLSIVYSVYVK